jgi:hypothetical protein
MVREGVFRFSDQIMLRNARVLEAPARRVQQQSGGWA